METTAASGRGTGAGTGTAPAMRVHDGDGRGRPLIVMGGRRVAASVVVQSVAREGRTDGAACETPVTAGRVVRVAAAATAGNMAAKDCGGEILFGRAGQT
jgi:hypothetical protein